MLPGGTWSDVWARLRPQLVKLARQPLLWLAALGGLALLAAEAALQMRAPAPVAAPAAGALASPDAASDWVGNLSLVVSVCAKLALVIALIYGCLWVVRRWQGGWFSPRQKQITLLESTRLSPRQALHLVRVGQQVLLVGATDQSLTLLTEVAWPAQPEAAAPPLARPAALPFTTALDHALAQPEAAALPADGKFGVC